MGHSPSEVPRDASAAVGAEGAGVAVKRAYEPPAADDGWRVLVDRVWPRGLSSETLRLDERRPDLAPSAGLRRWFGHDPDRWDEFRRRYRAELAAPAARRGLDGLAERARTRRVTLVYSARDEAHNQARVLAEVIEERLAGGRAGRAGRGDPGGPGRATGGDAESSDPDRRSARGTGGAAHVARESPQGAARTDPGPSEASDPVVVDAVERLIRAGVAVTTHALAERQGVELTVQQWRVLVLVGDAGGLRVGAIAARIGQSLPSASRIVGRLAERGLVKVDADPADGRAVVVRATPAGRRVVRAVLAARRRLVAEALTASGQPLPPGSGPVVEALARALDHLV